MLDCMTPPLRGVTPLYGIYVGMCSPKGYGFSAVLVINRVSILADFGHLGHSKKGMVLYSSLDMGMFLTISLPRPTYRFLLCLTPDDFTLSNARRLYSV